MKLSTVILLLMSATSVAAINRGAKKKETVSPLRRRLPDMGGMGGGGGGGGGGCGCAVSDGSPAVEETADDSRCTICDQDNKITPNSLTLIYNPV